ncbi:hypothetical protein CI610_02600 [invertebrate metagenome]|uniref:DUF2059 domain-containing protein n=1 Tax=invertebrate metagenome TaxID=1711999 RepID=A0A2H9T5F4_9ZZZZ
MDRILVMAVIVTYLSFPLHARLESKDKSVLLDELYRNAQMENQLSWLRDGLMLEKNAYALPAEVVNTVNRIVSVRYSSDYYQQSMLSSLGADLSIGDLLELTNWYDSPLGQKIIRLEMMANDPTNKSRVQAYIDEHLSVKLPRSERVLLVEQLIEALDAVNSSAELSAGISVRAQKLLQVVMPEPDHKQEMTDKIQIGLEEPLIREQLQKQIRQLFLYTYRSLSDDELKSYLDFARSSTMQHFQRSQVHSLVQLL